jgi:hypothetical protein
MPRDVTEPAPEAAFAQELRIAISMTLDRSIARHRGVEGVGRLEELLLILESLVAWWRGRATHGNAELHDVRGAMRGWPPDDELAATLRRLAELGRS